MSTRTKTIDNPIVIAGLMREALFHGAVIRVNQTLKGTIADIAEHHRRSKSEIRSASIAVESSELPAVDAMIELAMEFPWVRATGLCRVVDVTAGHLHVSFPESMQLIDQRSAPRIATDHLECIHVPMLLMNDESDHYEGVLEIADISAGGVGGTLVVDKGIPVHTGCRAQGVMASGIDAIQINGIVLAARMGEIHGGRTRWRVSISRTVMEATATSSIDRRREQRVESSLQLSFLSLMNPKQSIPLSLTDVSVSGFSATCDEPLTARLILPGSTLRLESRSLVSQVLSFDNQRVRAQWVYGPEADRAWWLKTITKALSSSSAIATPAAAELMSIFCESGSLGAEFLKAHRDSAGRMMKGIEQEGNRAAYIHRWIDRGRDGRVHGHISAVKSADNVWILGDLVGGADEDRRITKGFIDKFMVSFKDFCQSLAPCPRCLLLYVKGHPYWVRLEEHMSGFREPWNHAFDLGYTRTTAAMKPLPSMKCVMEEVLPTRFDLLADISAQLQAQQLLEVARGFDFDPDRLGSTRLRDLIHTSGDAFWRRYFRCQLDSSSWLVILTCYPEGKNPNRLVDSAWVFPLTGNGCVNGDEWDAVVGSTRRLGLALGVSIPSVRRVYQQGNGGPLAGEDATMRGHLAHPQVLDYFRGKA